MEDAQKAAALRILARAVSDLANVLDGGTTSDETEAPASPAPKDDVLSSLPGWARKRAKYLQAYVDNGGQLTLEQVTAAAKAAGYGNPGSATSRGYVEMTGAYHEPRAITPKGLAWLEKQTGKTA